MRYYFTLRKLAKYPILFYARQNWFRKRSWSLNKFTKGFDLMDKRCILLGDILMSGKCPSCNKTDCLNFYDSYDSRTVQCTNCNQQYYQCNGFTQFGEFAASLLD
jgi:hypothetical protein